MRRLFGNGRIWMGVVVLLGMLALATPVHAADGAKEGAKIFDIVVIIGDVIVISLLVAGSIVSVAIIIDAILHIRQKVLAPVETVEHLRSLISARQFKELMDFTTTDQSFVSRALNAALRRAHLGYPSMRESLEVAEGQQTANLFRKIEMLNVIGNIGPLLGLLGTVLGMILAFSQMQEKGTKVEPTDLSGGIARALWHTFGGLLVAVPSLVAYGAYRTRIDKLTADASVTAEDLLESLRPEGGKAGGLSDESRAPMARPAPKRVTAPTETV